VWRSVTDDWSGGNGTTVISTPEAILVVAIVALKRFPFSLLVYSSFLFETCIYAVVVVVVVAGVVAASAVLFQPAAASLHHRQSDHKSERQATFTEIATLRQHRQHRQQQQLTFRRLDAQHRPDLIYTFPNGPNRRQIPTIPPIMASINIWRYPSHL